MQNSPPQAAPPGLDLSKISEDDVVSILASGQHRTVLEGVFGIAEYAELHRLAKRALRIKPGSVRVYILPGIMGSALGEVRRSKVLPVWLNPSAIAAGELLSLALPEERRLQPLGVMLPGYLKLKLHLSIAGFDARFHPFDWRKSVLHSGKALAKRIVEDRRSRRIKQSLLVGHSMGGLVARAALTADTKRLIGGVVQLGSPNFGSYALVQALRAAYPTVRKVAALDPHHTTDQLVRHAFRTFPGLYEMLPSPAHTGDLDLWQLDNWPNDLVGPDATLLAAALKSRSKLGEAHAHCHHIVGVGQETVTQIRAGKSGFEYGITQDGDGTVPRELTEWPGASAWYVRERHGNLANNESVCLAIIDLLKRGTTRRVSRTYAAVARGTLRWVGDTELRKGTIGGRGKVTWAELPIEERRRILEPVISPEFHHLAET